MMQYIQHYNVMVHAFWRSLLLALYSLVSGSGGLEHLLQYETERQQSNVPTMAAAEGLNWLYTSTLTPFMLLRSIGLSLTNAFPPVKVGKILYLSSHTFLLS